MINTTDLGRDGGWRISINLRHWKQTAEGFLHSNRGPFWMNMKELLSSILHKPLGTTEEDDLTKVELLVELRKMGYDTTAKRHTK